jgi:hypothetical protein
MNRTTGLFFLHDEITINNIIRGLFLRNIAWAWVLLPDILWLLIYHDFGAGHEHQY